MSADLAEEKRALRLAMRAAREALERRRAGVADGHGGRAAAGPARLRAVEGRVIAGYIAVGGELSPAGALAFVRDGGGTVALPRVSDAAPRLRFHRWRRDPPAHGAFGLLEPPETAPEIRAGRRGGA